MSKRAFHIYNILFFLLLLVFNAFALFGAGMSQDSNMAASWLTVSISFILWALFYIFQFVRSSKSWRLSWFIAMIVCLVVWETGFGMKISWLVFP